HAAILLPWLIVRGDRRALVTAAIGMVVVFALPVVRYGIETTVQLHKDWLRSGITSTGSNLANTDKTSCAGMYDRAFGLRSTATAVTAATIVLAVAVVAWMCAKGRHLESPVGLEGAVLLVLMPLISPQGWDYVLLLATPAVAYLVNYEDCLPPALRL